MAKGKSTWKYNKLLTARRNYFAYGGSPVPINKMTTVPDSSTIRAELMNNIELQPTLSGVTDIQKTGLINPQPIVVQVPPTSPRVSATPSNNSDWALGGLAGGIGFLADATTNMANNIAASDIKARKKELLTSTNNQQMKAQAVNDTFDSIAHDYATTATIKDVDKYDLGAKSAGAVFTEGLVGGLKGSLAGLGAGSAIQSMAGSKKAYGGPICPVDKYDMKENNKYMGGGPIGAIVGGVLGTGMSLIGNLFRNHAAAKAANEVNNQIAYTNDFNQRSLLNRVDNVNASQLRGLEANYAAFGGDIGGAIEFDFMNRYIAAKEAAALGKDKSITSMPNSFADGGMSHGAGFTNGLISINEGGSHSTNPFEGVPMGVDSNGTPNLVEEGETIFNDYVFSRRLKVPKAIRSKYKLGGPISFADASKKLAKESEERPNDPISQNGLKAIMSDLANAQEGLKASKQSNQFADGGKVNKFSGKDTPSQRLNTYKNYTQLGKDTDFYTKEYLAFWDYMKNPENREEATKWLNKINSGAFGEIGGNTFTLDDIQRLSRDYKKGPVHNAYEQAAAEFAKGRAINPIVEPEVIPSTPQNTTPAERNKASRYYYNRGTADNPDYVLYEGDNAPLWMRNNKYFYNNSSEVSEGDTDYTDYYYDPNEKYTEGKYADWLRYAPAAGFGIGVLGDTLGLTNRPDYSNADAILEATRGSGTYQPVGFNPIGNYLAYKPFDRDYYTNKLNAESGATRRAILQNAGLNRGAGMAAILAADNNAQNQLGQLSRQAEEYNLAQRQQVEDFNRSTNITNSQGFLQADIANQKALAELRDFNLKGTIAAAQMRESARQSADAAKSANLSGLFQTLGDIGYEERNARMRDWAINHGVFGPGTEDYGRTRRASKGGKIKRKRGLTF